MATKAEKAAPAPERVDRLMVLNDKGGIGKSLVIQALSLEMAAQGVDHKVVEAETDARLMRVLGAERVVHHALSEDSLRAIRRNPDLAGEYWDNVAESFAEGVRLLDMGANASKLFWHWFASGSGRLVLGDGSGMGVLVVTSAEGESIRGAADALARASVELPAAKLFLVANEHLGTLPPGSPVLDKLTSAAGERAADVVRVTVPKCVAPAWPALVNTGKPLSVIATMRPQELVPLGFKIGAAARSITDVAEWLDELRPELRRILAACGMVQEAVA